LSSCDNLASLINHFTLALLLNMKLFCPVQEWISTNNVLSIVLRDSLHQPQYVEKLEKIIRFMIKEKTLTLEDLDKIWDAQVT
jgi:hypothetical protein